jgi:AbrB family looped-hinge helix DNA binding protein
VLVASDRKRAWLSPVAASPVRPRLRIADGSVRCHLTEVKTSVSTKGQVVLPAELRARDAIEPGQEFVIERIDRGEYRLVRIEPRNEGLVDWLLSCPDKGYFVPIESESTDSL